MLICSILKFKASYYQICLNREDLLMSELGLESLLSILHDHDYLIEDELDDPVLWERVVLDIESRLEQTIDIKVIEELWDEDSMVAVIHDTLTHIQNAVNREEYYNILVVKQYSSLLLVEG